LWFLELLTTFLGFKEDCEFLLSQKPVHPSYLNPADGGRELGLVIMDL
jgi:hypothetical protein